MTATHWVMIFVAFWSTVSGLFMLHINRRMKKRDDFEAKCAEFVTREYLNTQLGGISEEGIAREERITTAVDRQTLTIGSELRELRNEIRQDRTEVRKEFNEQSRRVDELIRLNHGGGYRRT